MKNTKFLAIQNESLSAARIEAKIEALKMYASLTKISPFGGDAIWELIDDYERQLDSSAESIAKMTKEN